MRIIIANIIVFCLLLITAHSVAAGEHLPKYNPELAQSTQQGDRPDAQMTNLAKLEKYSKHNMPNRQQDKQQEISSDCNICHSAHNLVIIAAEEFSLKIFSSHKYETNIKTILTSPFEDISHPPIIHI